MKTLNEVERLNIKEALEQILSRSFREYNASLDILLLEEDNIRIARLVAELAIERYKLGIISAFEMQESQRSLLIAENKFESAKYKAKISELQLLKSTERLLRSENSQFGW